MRIAYDKVSAALNIGSLPNPATSHFVLWEEITCSASEPVAVKTNWKNLLLPYMWIIGAKWTFRCKSNHYQIKIE